MKRILTPPSPIEEYVRSGSLHFLVDADTLDLKIDLGYDFFAVTRMRLAWLDAFEVTGPEKPQGKAASAFVLQWFGAHPAVLIRTYKAKKKEKYGRYLAEIWPADGKGESLNQELLTRGHAVPMEY